MATRILKISLRQTCDEDAPIIAHEAWCQGVFQNRIRSRANHRKQKNGWQKNGDQGAVASIFLPGIFLL
jgi:hypothetical protein